MRGRKRLRKKLLAKKAQAEAQAKVQAEVQAIAQEKSKAILTVSLELGESLPEGASLGVVEQFRNECLKPEGLLFNAKSTGIGWNGKIENTSSSLLTEEHRELIADWAFMQEEINSYSISHLSTE